MKTFGKTQDYQDFRAKPQQWHASDKDFKRSLNTLPYTFCQYDKKSSRVIIHGNQPPEGPVGFGVVMYEKEGDKYVNPTIIAA